MDTRELHEENRIGWDEAAGHYETLVEGDIEFLRNGGMNFVAPEFEYLANLKDWCHRAIHLQCAGGKDTLSLWNLGAHEVIGVDISPRMLACAQKKSDALNAPATWIWSDVLDTPDELNGTADLVYTGRGALCWQMDIDAWARAAARLVKPGGKLFVFDGHPITWIWDMEAAEYKLDPKFGDYFSTEIMDEQGWPESYIPELDVPVEEQARMYERQWTIAQITNAVIGAGLRIERLGEHPDPYWQQFPNIPEDLLRRLPQTFSLLASKPY